ncbi:thiamine ABC transporter substrate-binding protein [Clostridium novyi A str. 4552]|uniref:Thiamine ABC transporter substrate-binding protein n=1 Tax=Clostridium novyi A str. 4552 TaxID=1444289 RepID=A0A0A0IB30_CLONO|nr:MULTISPECIES: ABC-F family ATP-binding cassette domain-containing protein [Clostridium]KEH93884.1 thiamine ABC transporter substrate-binding protein [Clostridium botulinum C/D str. It1]KEH94695.1 thiamine ABC transporter substrate-binding protein [Clostridium novyi A str. GD211209]KGM96790.1 thiamine ABC transporter substrate-binding protein [Clostridium novyi A str. 4552]
MIVLSCKNLKKSYGIDEILKNITFNIDEGERVGLVGANGAGKSTLFKILTKTLDYDSGDLFLDKNKKVGYLSQHLSLDSENSIYDEALLVFQDLIDMENKLALLEQEMNKPYDPSNADYHNKVIKDYTNLSELYNNRGGYLYKAEIGKVLKGLGFTEEHYDKSINILSGGQKTRVALCKLLLSNPDILLLDEPTNHLDLDAIEWLEEYLKGYKGTIIIISHDRFFLDCITTKTFELINGKLDVYNGNYTAFIDLKKKAYEEKLKAYNLQQAEIKRQEEIIERYRSFNREKSIRAAESRQKALDKVERLDSPTNDKKMHKFKFEAKIKSGNDVLYAENLSKRYEDKLLFENLNLDIKRGEHVALIGENGRGKTTLFKILMDKIKQDEGTFSLGKNVFIGYYDQEQSNLDPNKTIIDEVWDDFPKMTTTEIRNVLAAFLFTGDDVFKKVEKLSGGEKCRINLLKIILSKSNFLLLDEPTNHLDIMSREALEDAIMDYDGTVLVISHDRYFLNKVVEKIHELNIDGIKTYLGNYSYYVEKKKNPLRFQQLEEAQGKTKTQIQTEKKKKREEAKIEKQKKLKVKNLEQSIADLEKNIEDLQQKLCLEEIYSDPVKSEEVNKELLDKETELEQLYEQWEEML